MRSSLCTRGINEGAEDEDRFSRDVFWVTETEGSVRPELMLNLTFNIYAFIHPFTFIEYLFSARHCGSKNSKTAILRGNGLQSCQPGLTPGQSASRTL